MGKKQWSPEVGLLPVLLLFLCLFASPAPGGERDANDALRQLLIQYDAVNAEINHMLRQAENPDPAPEYPERLLSYRKNARVAVGGEIRLDYIYGSNNLPNYKADDPFFANQPLDKARLTDFGLTTATVSIDARVNRWRAFVEMNLNGFSGFQQVSHVVNPNAPGQPVSPDYIVENREYAVGEAYIEMLKDGHSGLGFKAGLMDLPFGLATRPDLIGRSFLDAPNLTGSYLMRPMSRTDGMLLPHASRFLDPVTAAMVSYEMRDIIRFEAAIFQEYDSRRNHYRRLPANGYDKYRGDSSPLLSHQIGFSILPLEGWELSATYRNRNSRTRGLIHWANSPYRTDFRDNLVSGAHNPSWEPGLGQWSDTGTGEGFGSRRNEQAFTVGVALDIPNTMLSVQLEYAHGWNQGFNKHINSDNVNFGMSYRLTPRLTLHGQAEWLHVKDRSWMASTGSGWGRDTRNSRLYRFLLGAEYELARGLTLEAGWQYEYWNYSSSMGLNGAGKTDRVLTATMLYMGTRFLF